MRRYIIILILLLMVTAVSAQQFFTLEKCREMALEHNKEMAISSQRLMKAEREVKVAGSNFLPTFSADGLYYFTSSKSERILSTSVLPDIPLKFTLNNTLMAGVNVEQPIYMGGKIVAGYKMSKLARQMNETNRILTRSEVIVETDKAYWMLVRAEELRLTALAYQDAVQQLLQDVENGVKAGMMQRNDLLKVQVNLNEANLQLLRAENAIRLAQMNLCQVVGLPLYTDLQAHTSFSNLPETQSNNLPMADITMRPEYLLLNKQVELSKQRTKVTRADYLPTVGVAGSYTYIDGVRLNDTKLMSRGGFSAAISVKIPLFEWGRGINKVRSAKFDEQISRLQLQQAEEKMTLEVAQAMNAFTEAQLESAHAARSIEQAEENMRLSKDLYEVGMETLPNFLEAQTMWQKACSDYVNARAQEEVSRTEYLKAAGKL